MTSIRTSICRAKTRIRWRSVGKTDALGVNAPKASKEFFVQIPLIGCWRHLDIHDWKAGKVRGSPTSTRRAA